MKPTPIFASWAVWTLRLGVGLAALTGCNAADVSETAAADETLRAGRTGMVVLSHEVGDRGVAISGHFAAFSGWSQAEVLYAVASPEVDWWTSAAPEPGECRLVSAAAGQADGRIDLLSAGDLRVTPPTERPRPLSLPPRELPPLSFSLGGAVYDADDPQALPFVPGGTYQVMAPGDEIGTLSAVITAPPRVHLARHDLATGGRTIRWIGVDGPVRVLLMRDRGGQTFGVDCAGTGGALTIPALTLSALGAGPASLQVARIERIALSVEGLDTVDLLFITRASTEVHLPPEGANGD